MANNIKTAFSIFMVNFSFHIREVMMNAKIGLANGITQETHLQTSF